MAFVANKTNNQDTEKDNQNLVLSSTGGGVLTSGQSAVQPQQPQAPAKTQTSFTNIQKYLDQNRGAGQANADRLVAPVETAVNKAAEQTTANTQSVKTPQIATGNINDIVRSAPLNSENINKLRQNLGAQYAGPTAETMDWSQVDLAAKQARESANQLGTEAGRIEALQKQQGGTGSRGAAVLDNLFIQTEGDTGQRLGERIEGLAQRAGDLGTQGRADVAKRVAEAQGVAQAAKVETQKSIQDLINQRRAEAQQQAERAAEAEISLINQARQRLASQFTANPQQLTNLDTQLLGLDGPQTVSLLDQIRASNPAMFGLGLNSNMLTNRNVSINPQTRIDAETAARLNALGELVGQNPLADLGPVNRTTSGINAQEFMKYLQEVAARRGNNLNSGINAGGTVRLDGLTLPNL